MKRSYALCANGLRDTLRPAIARIKPGCAPTLFTMQMNDAPMLSRGFFLLVSTAFLSAEHAIDLTTYISFETTHDLTF